MPVRVAYITPNVAAEELVWQEERFGPRWDEEVSSEPFEIVPVDGKKMR